MADFFSNLADAGSQYLNNRANQLQQTFSDPAQALINSIFNTGTQAQSQTPPVQAPVAPNQMGPTVAANQGQQPNNPLNGMGETPAATPNGLNTAISPANQINPSTVSAPTAPVANQQASQPIAPTPHPQGGPQAAPPQGPAVPPSYSQQIAGQESGNNPNVGYHNPAKSTAYGTYGLTAPAYQDVQSTDPYFAGKAITDLTPDEQTRALGVLTNLNSDRLQKNGVEANDTNLRLAHFLGATGAANYLKNGSVSEAASKANGGEARLRHTIDNIIRGSAENVSGAPPVKPTVEANPAPSTITTPVNQTYPDGSKQDHLDTINGTDTAAKLQVASKDSEAPDHVKALASESAYNDLKYHKEMQDASAKVNTALNNGNINDLYRDMNKKGNEGSFIKAVLYARLGLNDLAAQEQQKISPTLKASAVMLGNDHYTAVHDKDGNLIKAYNEAGDLVNPSTLAKISASSLASQGLETGQTMMKDPQGNMWSHSIQKGTNQVVWTNQTTGQAQTTAPSGLTPFGQVNPVTKATIQTAATAERNMRRTNDAFVKQGLPPKYSEDDINNMKVHITNGGQVPSEVVTSQTPSASTSAPTSPTAPTTKPSLALPDELETQAQEIYAGRQPMPTGLGATNLRNQALVNRVQAIAKEKGVPYDSTRFKGVIEPIVKDFATGKSKENIDALKTSFNHIDELTPAIQELNNGRFPAANAIINKFATAVGGSNATTVEQIGPIVGNEIEKTWNPRMGTADERRHIVDQFSSARNSEQLNKAVETYKQLMMGKLKPLEDRYEQTGKRDFWSNQVNDENIKSTYDRWKAGENVRHGQPSSGTTSGGIKWKRVD